MIEISVVEELSLSFKVTKIEFVVNLNIKLQ